MGSANSLVCDRAETVGLARSGSRCRYIAANDMAPAHPLAWPGSCAIVTDAERDHLCNDRHRADPAVFHCPVGPLSVNIRLRICGAGKMDFQPCWIAVADVAAAIHLPQDHTADRRQTH